MAETEANATPTGTNSPAAASTSSAATDTSRLADPVTALGERILAELGDPRTNDTLTRWLSHHVARLIDAADQAATCNDTDADNRAIQARTAILELWEHRSAWTQGWPPSRAAALVRLLDDLPEADDPGWRSRTVLSRLQLLHHRLLGALTDLAVAEGATIAEGWLKTFGDRLTPDEAALLTRVASAPRRLAMLFSDDLTTVRRRPRSIAASSGVTAGIPEADSAIAQNVEHDEDIADNEITDDDTDDATPNPVLEIAEEYRDVVADLLQRSGTDGVLRDDTSCLRGAHS